jgi:hypothetical protein
MSACGHICDVTEYLPLYRPRGVSGPYSDMPVLTDGNDTNAAKLDALQRAARARDVELLIHRVVRGDEIAQSSTARRHRAPQR